MRSALVRPPILGIDHVQIAIPVGGEDQARDFYVGLLGMCESDKPPGMAARGGAWFACGAHQLHVGGEASFVPAKKAHPAFALADPSALRALAGFLEAAGHAVRWSHDVPGFLRFHTNDPFGNRLEFGAADR